jgi:hypothetical protein
LEKRQKAERIEDHAEEAVTGAEGMGGVRERRTAALSPPAKFPAGICRLPSSVRTTKLVPHSAELSPHRVAMELNWALSGRNENASVSGRQSRRRSNRRPHPAALVTRLARQGGRLS